MENLSFKEKLEFILINKIKNSYNHRIEFSKNLFETDIKKVNKYWEIFALLAVVISLILYILDIKINNYILLFGLLYFLIIIKIYINSYINYFIRNKNLTEEFIKKSELNEIINDKELSKDFIKNYIDNEEIFNNSNENTIQIDDFKKKYLLEIIISK